MSTDICTNILTSMKIYIDQISESGLELTESYDPSALDLDRKDIRFKDTINVSAQITKAINNISVKLKVEAIMYINCSRCLEEFTSPLSKEAQFDFPIEGKEIIDITENLREEIVFAYPLKPLCCSDCKGLCKSCGQNLNKGTCKCLLNSRF